MPKRYILIKNHNHAIDKKIDHFMNNYIILRFNPNEIHWWFSLSGGKDSYSMCLGIYLWYIRNGFDFQGTGFMVKQWDNDVISMLQKQIDWLQVICVDAFDDTKNILNYQDGDQSPCKQCSDIRKSVGDRVLFKLMPQNKVNLIVRGLHLSDTAISFLWRWVYNERIGDSLFSVKYLPLTQINERVFLAKPLLFVRETETEEYSRINGYISSCCNCPACRYPSRRDIVEESVLSIYKSENNDYWELSVPGISDYLNYHAPNNWNDLIKASVGGFASKCNHIPDEFFTYALDYFKSKAKHIDMNIFDNSNYLDDIGKDSLLKGRKTLYSGKTPIPKLFCKDMPLADYERRMISTLGPFWGFIGLDDEQRKQVMDLQTDIFDYTPDKMWEQVIYLLNKFYKGEKLE